MGTSPRYRETPHKCGRQQSHSSWSFRYFCQKITCPVNCNHQKMKYPFHPITWTLERKHVLFLPSPRGCKLNASWLITECFVTAIVTNPQGCSIFRHYQRVQFNKQLLGTECLVGWGWGGAKRTGQHPGPRCSRVWHLGNSARHSASLMFTKYMFRHTFISLAFVQWCHLMASAT